jgi:hypothetical protein
MDTGSPPYKLYSAKAITLATFLGAPIAGCILLAHNFRKLGDTRAATAAVIWGIVITAVIMIVCFFLPEKFPNSVIPAVYTVSMYQFVKHRQAEALSEHVKHGGSLASAWAAAGIGLVWLCLLLLLCFGVFFVIDMIQPNRS